MRELAVLLSYFREADAAQAALRYLGKHGFRRRILLRRTSNGHVVQLDPARRSRILFAALTTIFVAAVTIALTQALLLPDIFGVGSSVALLYGMIGLGAGGSLGLLLSTRLFPGVSKIQVEAQLPRLRGEEALIILEAPIHLLQGAVHILRDVIEAEVAIFVLHPRRLFPQAPALPDMTALALPQIQEHAAVLAHDHVVDTRGGASRELLAQLEQARETIHVICHDMGESSRLEQSIGPVAEWILDNEYLIEGHSRDVQINLPKSYYRELPKLIEDPDRDQPRVYSVAKELVAHSDARLDRENILGFLTSYQSNDFLEIGELWALPLLLRIALIQRVEQLARQAWGELTDRESAEYWANRLLTTLRREPDQLFAVLAELSNDQPRPSAFFATQLSGNLYDEDAALVPVQSWLERSLRRPLTELNSGEQARQAANQISIGNAITSLRQLSRLDWREIFEHLSQVELILRRDPAGVYPQMDFETRNLYRETVEVLARGSTLGQVQVARKVD